MCVLIGRLSGTIALIGVARRLALDRRLSLAEGCTLEPSLSGASGAKHDGDGKHKFGPGEHRRCTFDLFRSFSKKTERLDFLFPSSRRDNGSSLMINRTGGQSGDLP